MEFSQKYIFNYYNFPNKFNSVSGSLYNRFWVDLIFWEIVGLVFRVFPRVSRKYFFFVYFTLLKGTYCFSVGKQKVGQISTLYDPNNPNKMSVMSQKLLKITPDLYSALPGYAAIQILPLSCQFFDFRIND